MLRTQAALFLGVPPSTLDKFVAEGRLHISFGGPGGLIPWYGEEELIHLKNELEAQTQAEADRLVNAVKLIARIVDGISPPTEAHKGAFTVQGAAAISGLSESTLRRDIKEGYLKAQKVESVWRIKRPDFYRYLRIERPK